MLREIETLTRQVQTLENALNGTALGAIICEKRGDTYRYVHKYTLNKKLVRKVLHETTDLNLIKKLIKKYQIQQKLFELRRSLAAAQAYQEAYESFTERERQNPEGFAVLVAHIFPLTDYEAWGSAPYNDSRDFHSEQLVHPTGKGDEKVRSKSEVLIARALQAHGIQYHYEEVTQVGYNTYRPDFTIRHPVTGVIIIWEHFGMMDKDNYAWSAADKIRNYMKSGYSQTTNFITTFEDKAHPLDIDTIEDAINRLLLNDPVER